LMNFTVQGSIGASTIHTDGDYTRIDNLRVIGTVAANDGIYCDGQRGMVTRCHITGFTKAGQYAIRLHQRCTAAHNTIATCNSGIQTGVECLIIGNHLSGITLNQIALGQNAICDSNVLRGAGNSKIIIEGVNVTIRNNMWAGTGGITWQGNHDYVTIIGNHFEGGGVDLQNVNVQWVVITGNHFGGGFGVDVDAQEVTITGNVFYTTAFVNLSATAKYCTVSGNNFQASNTKIVDVGVGNTAIANVGVPCLMEKSFSRMKNTSGGALVAGNILVMKAVAAGDEVDTTVVAGDDMICGMLDEAANNNVYAAVQHTGFTSRLKVNGTVNIAIGDFISCTNVAGIGRKAVVGHMAVAMALEAYAGADSNGVINALLMVPRKI